MYKEIELSKYRKTGRRFSDSDPYTIAFVYPKDAPPYVVKGMCDEVKEYIQVYSPVAFYRYTYWFNGKSRGGWKFTMPLIYVWQKNKRFEVTDYRSGKGRIMSFRRMPHRWIPEFDPIPHNNG